MTNDKFPYRVRGVDIKHDGQDYVEGSVIELDDDTASTLKAYLERLEVAPVSTDTSNSDLEKTNTPINEDDTSGTTDTASKPPVEQAKAESVVSPQPKPQGTTKRVAKANAVTAQPKKVKK